jgi:hypothetical protein
MKAVVTLYKGKETREVHAVDVDAWLKEGWKLEADPTERGVNEELVKDVLPLTQAVAPKSEKKTLKLEKDVTANDR